MDIEREFNKHEQEVYNNSMEDTVFKVTALMRKQIEAADQARAAFKGTRYEHLAKFDHNLADELDRFIEIGAAFVTEIAIDQADD